MSFSKDDTKAAILKKLVVLLVSILVVFATINAVWYFGYQKRYNNMAKYLEKGYSGDVENEKMLKYGTTVGEYQIALKMPEYLGSGGFVSVSKPEEFVVEQNEMGETTTRSDASISLFIWPNYFSGFDLGVWYFDFVGESDEQIMITQNLDLANAEELDPEYVAHARQLIEANKDKIQEMFEVAEKTLEIKLTND